MSYVNVDDEGALDAFIEVCRIEGIIPALETAHAFRYAKDLARTMSKKENILICLSGRGDKDVAEVSRLRKGEFI